MKKVNKLILCSLILALSIIGGSVFVGLKQQTNMDVSAFYGYNDSYISTTDKNYLTEIELTNNYTSLPSTYDLRDYIQIKVEDQKTYGICYAFGSLTMLETYLALTYNEYYDFSEIHLATSKYVDNGTVVTDPNGKVVDSDVDFDSIYGGGNFYNFYDYCMKGLGPVLEVEMPMSSFYSPYNVETYEDYAETYYNTYKSEFSKLVTVNQFVTFLDGATLSDTDKITNRNNIKQHITTYGSCVSSIYSSTFGVYNNTQYLNSVDATANHLISIIGWDDNYQPDSWTNPGAYLCLNSWGEDIYGGVFYVSYDDFNIESDVYGISDAEINCDDNVISNYENFSTLTTDLARTSLWNVNSTGQSFVATVTDVSNKLNSYINEISLSVYYPTSSTPEIYLGFVDSTSILDSSYQLNDTTINSVYPSKKINIESYSNITNYNSYLSGNTLFNIKLSNPVQITGKYAVLIVKTNLMFKLYGLESPASTNPLLNTFWNANMSRIISSDNTSLLILTRFKTSNSSEYQTDNTDKFVNETIISNESGFVYNNATSFGNTMSITIENPTTDITQSDVEIYKVTSSSTALSKTDVTEYFNIEKQENKVLFTLNSNLNLGVYIVKIVTGENTFYKSFELVSSAITHTITYELNGGTNNSKNSSTYSEDLSSLIIYHPSKTGYVFKGWYLDAEFNNKLTGTEGSSSYGDYTEYSDDLTIDLSLYAKWEIESPNIVTQPTGINATYSGNASTLTCKATHPLGSSNIKYQWFKDNIKIETATSESLKVTNVKESGTYYCEISYDSKSVKTNEVEVTISKANYNLSLNNTTFTYDGTLKTVDIKNPSQDLEYTISNNSKTNAGNYTASINFTSWNENYNKPSITNLSWKINPAELIVEIKNASVSNLQDYETFNDFNYELHGTIYDDYDLKINYYCLDTENDYIKLINATYASTTNYNVTIKTAYLKIAKQTISSTINDTTISTYNEIGYVTDATLTVTSINEQDLSSTNQKFIEDNDLIVYNIYNINVDDNSITTDNTISIDISKELAEKNLKVYKLTENRMELVTSSIDGNTLTFTSKDFGTFLIVEAPQEESIIPTLVSLGIILLSALACCFVIAKIKKHRNKKYYSSTTSIPH